MSEKPHSSAISEIDFFVLRSISSAALIRVLIRYSLKLRPVTDLNFFENRVNYYESIIINSDIFDEESPIEQIINAFEFVITYDLSGQLACWS